MDVKQVLRQAIFSPAYPKWLLGIFTVWFGVWAVGPPHLSDFLLEHLFTVAFVAFLCWSHGRFRLSNLSYTAIFVFLCLHVVGAHYTYSEVPYDAWLRRLGSWFGAPKFSFESLFGFERNHYDRLIHFSFGLLIAYPVREVFIRIVRVRGFWGYYLPLDVMMSFSLVYELIEWGVAVVIAGDVGQSYLGTQGDEWDSQKDMALASLGGLVAMTATALVNWRYGRDFADELTDSLAQQGSAPLGEVRIAEMIKQQRADATGEKNL
jgi:putative membrane protein